MAARYKPSAGFKPDKLMKDALVLALNRAAVDAEGKPTKKLAEVAAALVEAAIGKDVSAIREIFDRVDGKVRQETDITANVTVNDVEDNRPKMTGFLVEFIKTREADATKH